MRRSFNIMKETDIVNVTEEIVRGLVSFMLQSPEYQMFCHCKECELEVVAMTLNTLPSKYVVSKAARNNAFEYFNRPENIEYINKQIIRALHVVSKKGNHTKIT